MKSKSKTDNHPLQWHFPELQHADTEGLNDPLLQYFSGDYNWYIAREVIQNSVDARANGEEPVVVKFERITVPASEVPGLAELKKHLEVCLKQAEDEQNDKARKTYEEAVKATSDSRLAILRASDFNTTGLNGGDRDKRGKWHRLVKAVGENQVAGVGGGSYGIGKGAPYVASRLRAVYYSTMNEDNEVIFQGKARLMSHDLDGIEYRGVGSFGVNGHQSVRDPNLIPQNFLRSEQGTDINIIGYDMPLAWADELAMSVLSNFWMAVHSEILKVVIVDGLKETVIDKHSLREMLEKHCRNDALPYYRAVIDPTRKFEKQLPTLGTCHLFVRIEERFPKQIMYMRSPRMSVKTWRFQKTLQEPFAAVFLCDDPDGNLILRGLEPPEHDEWDPALDKALGKQVLDEVREWIRGHLLELAAEEGGDPEEIPELEKFLPYDEDAEKMSESKARTRPSGEVGLDETALEVGAQRDEVEDEIEEFVKKPSSTKETGGDGENTRKREGKDRKKNGGGTGTGDNDDTSGGIARINTSGIRFRVIHTGKSDTGNAEYCLILEPLIDQEGSLNIVALGEDSAVYPVAVAQAEEWSQSGKNYKHRGSFIDGLKLEKGKPVRIKVATKSSSRYALGVENHES